MGEKGASQLPEGGVGPDKSQTEEFVRLLLVYQTRLYGYILSLIPSYADADDVMQETLVVMWHKYAEEAPIQRFLAWAMSIARYKCMNHQKKHRGKSGFSPEALEVLGTLVQESVERQDERVAALEGCLSRLSEGDRSLLVQHYEQGQTVVLVAKRAGRSVQGMYKSMARIHEMLRVCIERALLAWGGAR